MSQSYLKAFAADEKGERIWRFGKDEGDPELKRIEKVAVKFHLYAPQGKDGRRDDALEKKLAELEQWFGEPIWQAICTDFPDYSWKSLRQMVALLAAITWLRTPRQFNYWKTMHRKFAEFFKRFEGDFPDGVLFNDRPVKLDASSWPAYRDASEEDMKWAWNEWVGQAAGVAEAFMKMRWAVIVSDDPVFITSDNPVMVGDPVIPFRGLKHPEETVTFPLSPTRLLVMDNRHHEPDAQYYPLKYDPASMNCLIWRNSMEHMFSPRHPDIICAEIVADAERSGFL